MSDPSHNKGFTLAELVVSIGLAVIVTTALAALTQTIIASRLQNQIIRDVEEQGMFALATIAQTVRDSHGITTPAVGESADSLTPFMPIGSDNPTVFDVEAGVLRYARAGMATAALTNNAVVVSNFLAQNLSQPNTPGIVRVQFTLTRPNASGQPTFAYTKTFYESIAVRY